MRATLEMPAPAIPVPAVHVREDHVQRIEQRVRSSLSLIDELYNYNHWIFNKVRPFIRGKVCEIGCGIGNITQFLLNHEHVTGVEPDADSHHEVQSRFRPHLNTRFARCTLEQCPNEQVPEGYYDTAVCLNVLEHIEDDVGGLNRMRQVCHRGGRVIILVPAHMSIYGELDRSFGHHRRYSRRTLRRAFEAAGLRVTYSFYMNALGYIGWWWQSCWQKREDISVSGARVFNRLVPFLDAAERIIRPPFGQSVVMVGTPAT